MGESENPQKKEKIKLWKKNITGHELRGVKSKTKGKRKGGLAWQKPALSNQMGGEEKRPYSKKKTYSRVNVIRKKLFKGTYEEYDDKVRAGGELGKESPPVISSGGGEKRGKKETTKEGDF